MGFGSGFGVPIGLGGSRIGSRMGLPPGILGGSFFGVFIASVRSFSVALCLQRSSVLPATQLSSLFGGSVTASGLGECKRYHAAAPPPTTKSRTPKRNRPNTPRRIIAPLPPRLRRRDQPGSLLLKSNGLSPARGTASPVVAVDFLGEARTHFFRRRRCPAADIGRWILGRCSAPLRRHRRLGGWAGTAGSRRWGGRRVHAGFAARGTNSANWHSGHLLFRPANSSGSENEFMHDGHSIEIGMTARSSGDEHGCRTHWANLGRPLAMWRY